jgi:hypothetical protein
VIRKLGPKELLGFARTLSFSNEVTHASKQKLRAARNYVSLGKHGPKKPIFQSDFRQISLHLLTVSKSASSFQYLSSKQYHLQVLKAVIVVPKSSFSH